MSILDPAKSPRPSLARAIAKRARGRTQGPATRLMSPSDFGEILKPFVFLDPFDHHGAPFDGGLHPHSGIATLSYVMEGAVTLLLRNGRDVALRGLRGHQLRVLEHLGIEVAAGGSAKITAAPRPGSAP
jgi:hypothetical protein